MIAVGRRKIVINAVLMITASFATFYILTVVIPLLRGILKLADSSQKRKVILFYTTVFGAKPSTIWPTTSFDTCEVPCRISDDKSSLLQSDAVIFHGRDMPEKMPTRRTTNQRWVYFIQENPHYTSPEPLKYNGMFNWTMTYKRSSDVWAPYGTYRTAEDNDLRRSYFSSGADRDFAAKKTRLAAWASSHCSSTGFLREQYVEKLQLYIPVDVFGNCNPRGPRCPRGSNMCNALLKKYKFYLAFENAFCEDYITEKYWEQALEHDMIPVVMGGADYDELVVPKSYINVLDFSSVESLASYLKTLDANSTAYNEYFYWKKQYEVLSTTPWCRLCEMLHNQSLPNKVYWDLGSFWGVKENCMRFSNKIKDQI
ncbi:alpha-(1-_3)-fucosyltransferase [Porites harrisoni]